MKKVGIGIAIGIGVVAIIIIFFGISNTNNSVPSIPNKSELNSTNSQGNIVTNSPKHFDIDLGESLKIKPGS